ncbi:MAG TPA: hypothetical protein VF068_06220 [Rubrobacter sp.]
MTTEMRIFPNVLRCGVTSSERVLRMISSDARARTESALAISGRGSVL